MIELTNLTTQTIPVGGAITFDKVVRHTGCGECFNSLVPTSVKLRASCGTYDIEFSANVTNEAAGLPVQLAIAAGGTQIPTTARNAVPAAAGDLWGISMGTYYANCCGDLSRISVINTGPNPVVVAPNSSLRIARRS